MATKVASLYADVNANISGFTAGMSSVKGQLGGVASSLAGFVGVATAAFGAAAVGAIAFQKALEFGDMGAEIGQTRSSFDNLATSLGQGPELLQQLQTATRGTVTEFSLMSSTNTLLIGTSGQLGQALAANAPQLAAIAQAARDVNPALGDTSFLYDSLARGIKRASPLILDNLGIIVKLEEEYRNYASTIGKTAGQLTAEEKSMAVLNATLREGNKIIEQAAQVNTSASTSIDKMQASLEDMGNAAKERAAPAIAGMADAITNMLTPAQQLTTNLTKTESAARASSQTYTEYSSAVTKAAQASGLLVLENGNLVDAHMNLVQAGYMLTSSEWQVSKTMGAVYNSANLLGGGLSTLDAKAQGFGNSLGTIDGGLSMLGQTFPQVTEAVGASEVAITAYGDRLTALGGYYAELEAAEQNRITTAGLMAGIQGTLGDATASYSATLAQLTEQETQITDALVRAQEQGYAPTSQKVTELTEALKLNQEAQGAALENLQGVTAEMLYQQAAAGLDTQAALDLARSMGVLSEADYTVATAMQQLREQFDSNHDGMITATEDASGFAAAASAMTQAIQSVQAKNLPLTASNIAKELDAMAKTEAESALSELAGAAEEGAEPLSDVASAAADAGAAAEDAASGLEDQNDALGDTQNAAQRAVAGLNSAASAARNATQPLRTAATAAAQLAGSLQDIPGRTSIVVTTSGVDSAIAELERLAGVIGSIPTNLTINVAVASTTPTTTSAQSPITSSYEAALPAIVSETYNIFDPLAAVILAEQKSAATRDRLEAVMHG